MAFTIDELTGDRRFLQASPDKQRAMLEAYTQTYGGPGLADALGSVTPADRRPEYGTAPQTAINYGKTESFGGGSGSGGFMRTAEGTTMDDFRAEGQTLSRGSGVAWSPSGKMYRVDPDYEYDVQHRTSDPDLRAAVPGIAQANQKRQAGLADLLQRQQGGAAAAKALEELAATRNAVLLNETMMSPEEQKAALARLDQAEARWMAVLGGGAGQVATQPAAPEEDPVAKAIMAAFQPEEKPKSEKKAGEVQPVAVSPVSPPKGLPTPLSDTGQTAKNFYGGVQDTAQNLGSRVSAKALMDYILPLLGAANEVVGPAPETGQTAGLSLAGLMDLLRRDQGRAYNPAVDRSRW